MEDDGVVTLGPARVIESRLPAVGISKGLGVGDGPRLHIEVDDVERAAGHGVCFA